MAVNRRAPQLQIREIRERVVRVHATGRRIRIEIRIQHNTEAGGGEITSTMGRQQIKLQ